MKRIVPAIVLLIFLALFVFWNDGVTNKEYTQESDNYEPVKQQGGIRAQAARLAYCCYQG